MERTAVNPTEWGLGFHAHQAEVVEGAARHFRCSGQVALVPDAVFINFSTTDIDGFLANHEVYAEWIAPAGVMPPQSLIGVSRLVLPELLVEIEVQAAA